MANESLIVGNSNWAVKANNLLGYAVGETSGYYVPRELNFTRNSTATYTDENGIIQTAAANIARVQDNALLLEPQRTNLVRYSEEFDNASWSKNAVSVTANNAVSPDGYSNADKIVPNTTNTNHYVFQNISVFSGAVYTYSYFAKADGYNFTSTFISALGIAANWDLQNATASAGASIVDYGNGWYRCIVTGTAISTGTAFVRIYSQETSNPVFAGNGTDGIYAWGAQFEQGAYATSYIPTTSATATRLADVISPITSTNTKGITNNYNTSVFIEVDNFKQNGLTRYFALFAAGGTNNPRVLLYSNNTSPTSQTLIVQYRVTGQADQEIQSGSFPISTKIKAAVILNGTNLTLFLNGVKVGTRTIVQGAIIDQLNPLMDVSNDNSHQVSKSSVFPNSLTDSQAIELTTL